MIVIFGVAASLIIMIICGFNMPDEIKPGDGFSLSSMSLKIQADSPYWADSGVSVGANTKKIKFSVEGTIFLCSEVNPKDHNKYPMVKRTVPVRAKTDGYENSGLKISTGDVLRFGLVKSFRTINSCSTINGPGEVNKVSIDKDGSFYNENRRALSQTEICRGGAMYDSGGNFLTNISSAENRDLEQYISNVHTEMGNKWFNGPTGSSPADLNQWLAINWFKGSFIDLRYSDNEKSGANAITSFNCATVPMAGVNAGLVPEPFAKYESHLLNDRCNKYARKNPSSGIIFSYYKQKNSDGTDYLDANYQPFELAEGLIAGYGKTGTSVIRPGDLDCQIKSCIDNSKIHNPTTDETMIEDYCRAIIDGDACRGQNNPPVTPNSSDPGYLNFTPGFVYFNCESLFAPCNYYETDVALQNCFPKDVPGDCRKNPNYSSLAGIQKHSIRLNYDNLIDKPGIVDEELFLAIANNDGRYQSSVGGYNVEISKSCPRYNGTNLYLYIGDDIPADLTGVNDPRVIHLGPLVNNQGEYTLDNSAGRSGKVHFLIANPNYPYDPAVGYTSSSHKDHMGYYNVAFTVNGTPTWVSEVAGMLVNPLKIMIQGNESLACHIDNCINVSRNKFPDVEDRIIIQDCTSVLNACNNDGWNSPRVPGVPGSTASPNFGPSGAGSWHCAPLFQACNATQVTGIAYDLYHSIMDSGIHKAVYALLILFIVIISLGFVLGIIELKTNELFIIIFKIGIMSVFLTQTSWDFFNRYLFDIFWYGPDDLIFRFMTFHENQSSYHYNASFAFLDKTVGTMLQWENLVRVFSLLAFGFVNPLCWFLFVQVIWAMFYLLKAAFKGIVLYCVCFIINGFLLSLAPIFFCFLLFKQTFRFFDTWIKQLISNMFLIVFYFIAIGMINEIIYYLLYRVLNYGVYKDCVWAISIGDLKLCLLQFPMPFPVSALTEMTGNGSNLESGLPLSFMDVIIFFIMCKVADIIVSVAGALAQIVSGASMAFSATSVLDNVSGAVKYGTGMDKESVDRRKQATKGMKPKTKEMVKRQAPVGKTQSVEMPNLATQGGDKPNTNQPPSYNDAMKQGANPDVPPPSYSSVGGGGSAPIVPGSGDIPPTAPPEPPRPDTPPPPYSGPNLPSETADITQSLNRGDNLKLSNEEAYKKQFEQFAREHEEGEKPWEAPKVTKTRSTDVGKEFTRKDEE